VRTEFVEERLVELVEHQRVDATAFGAVIPHTTCPGCVRIRRISIEEDAGACGGVVLQAHTAIRQDDGERLTLLPERLQPRDVRLGQRHLRLTAAATATAFEAGCRLPLHRHLANPLLDSLPASIGFKPCAPVAAASGD